MPWPLSFPGKDLVPIVQEVGWAPGLVWTGAENLAPTGIWSPDHPARSQSLYWLSYPAHVIKLLISINFSHLYIYIYLNTYMQQELLYALLWLVLYPRIYYLSWISGTWNKLHLQFHKHKMSLSSQTFHSVIRQTGGSSNVPTFQFLHRQQHFSPVPSLSIICPYQAQPKIHTQMTRVARVKKLILLPSMYCLVILYKFILFLHLDFPFTKYSP
jgi:hypothetical protein